MTTEKRLSCGTYLIRKCALALPPMCSWARRIMELPSSACLTVSNKTFVAFSMTKGNSISDSLSALAICLTVTGIHVNPGHRKSQELLTGHRRVESISHIRNITLRKGSLMRINSKRKVLLPLVRIGIRRSGRSKQTEADGLTFDGVAVLAFTQESASVAKVIGDWMSCQTQADDCGRLWK